MYSFEPNEEQQMLIDAVGKYAANDLRPAAHDAEEEREMPKKLISASNHAVGSRRSGKAQRTNQGRITRVSLRSMARTMRAATASGFMIGSSSGKRVRTPSNMPVAM